MKDSFSTTEIRYAFLQNYKSSMKKIKVPTKLCKEKKNLNYISRYARVFEWHIEKL